MNVLNKAFLALNVLLACALCAVVWHSSRPGSQPDIVVLPVATRPPLVAKPAAKPFRDLDLDSAGDWRQWVDALRVAGVPTPVIISLVQSGFDDRWMKRQASAEASYQNGEMDIDTLSALAIQHDRERELEARAAVGDDAFRSVELIDVLNNVPLQAVTLSLAQSNSVYAAEKKLQRVSQDVNELKLKGQIDQAECESRLTQAQAEHEESLKAAVGDETYAVMYPPQPLAAPDSQRRSMREVELPADLPFDAVLEMQSRWNQMRSDANNRLQEAKSQSANCEDELQKINDAWEMEYQRVLGTNTYDAVQKESDANYKEMKRYSGQWSLDEATMDYVYRSIQYYERARADYERQARALEAKGEDVDWSGVKKNLQQFGAELEQSLQTYLGQERFERLKYNNLLPFARKNTASLN